MSPFSNLFCLPQPSSASTNFWKEKKKKKVECGGGTLLKTRRIVVCLLCYKWQQLFYDKNPLNPHL